MRELFVYYRVEHDAADAARNAATAMHDRLRRQHPALDARLLMRVDDDTALQTWMETYAVPGPGAGVDARIEAAIEAEAATWASLRAGPRHVEAFATVESRRH